MARVAIVSYDVQTIAGKAGGVGAFATRWAELLRSAGDEVTIIMTRIDWEPVSVDAVWRERYKAAGIGLIELQAAHPSATRWPEVPTMRASEMVTPVLRDFDIAYFQDWGNTAFDFVRRRRYMVDQGPVCVTCVYGPSQWELSSNHRYPRVPEDLHLGFQERYAAEHCDFVVASSRYMPDQLAAVGWRFPGEVALLGLPMPERAATQTAPRVDDKPVKLEQIVYFARIEERKGIRLFVKALEHLAPQLAEKPEVVLFGGAHHPELLADALRDLKTSGYAVTHKDSIDSETSLQWLRDNATRTLCVVPSPADNYPYTIVEASLIPGLNLIVSSGGGVPDMLANAERQMAAPYPRDLAAKIAERLREPLSAGELSRYDTEKYNAAWLEFHRNALATREMRPKPVLPAVRATVDVCVTYYQKAPYLAQLMDALEGQTVQDFHVIAVDDGSPDDLSQRVFREQSERAAKHGWEFLTQENAFVDAARNAAASHGTGEYILFVDSDDVPAHDAVARMREALTLSGDDALICGSYLFASKTGPFDPATGEIKVPAYATCVPLGMDLAGGLLNPCCFGGSMFIIRRSVFQAMGGFREVRGAGHEDWETYVRAVLAGYKVDILPDLLQFYRQVEGSLARTLPSEAARRRLLDAYETKLTEVGLPGAALALEGLYRSGKQMEERLQVLQAQAGAPQEGFAFFSGATRRFEAEGSPLSLAQNMGRLQSWYRRRVSLETRLALHRRFLAPFLGQYKPPSA